MYLDMNFNMAYLIDSRSIHTVYDDDAPINKKLPKELLLRIFSFLDVVSLCRCAQVSKFWNILALDGSNWQRVDLFDFQKDVEGPVVVNISERCGGFLKSLSLRGCQSITDKALQIFANSCKNIEVLNLNNCKKITDITCESLGKNSKKLLKLNISSCSEITDNSLKAVSDGCKLLESLDISWCSKLSDNGLEALAHGCPKLSSFICQGCNQQLTDDCIHEIGRKCHNLFYLCVSNCPRLTDASLISLGNCSELGVLEVAGCNHLTDNGFQTLARTCNKLEKMDLEECIQITDATLAHLATYCTKLSALSLSHCELITDEGIRHIGSGPCATEYLQVLELDNCPLITDASLEHLMGCQGLERIELYDCQLITRAGIRRLRTHLPDIRVHAYFAPVTPPPSVGGGRQRYCKCCAIL
ncbi:hypothetical protein LOTGIDRAFT_156971 [Lottia gigantea]|uniref:F-box/LRR-repeat protein 2 n=1 Tax=Lottia gigantea TaxID=225164 RepID=V4CL66_LOTGI|nr:hypothetical protein LOTGIDRAFT_156971 [Lottia gigantea]ESP03015.1 hypothetical protein LOTGIDRAFT_156971 [Lottia gigantea]